MKTKKIVIGAMAAAMLSLSVCSVAPAVAADETVQISVGKTTAEAGGAFTVDVTIADIPAAGIQGANFAIEYDASLISITDVTAGALTETGAAASDASSSMLPNFNTYSQGEGSLAIIWSTASTDSSTWLKGEGTFCTLSGTVSADAAPGTVVDIKVVPTDRETYTGSGVANGDVSFGYVGTDKVPVKYAASITNGSVTVAGGSTSKYKRGDANCDGNVTIADATAILQHLGNKDKYGLSSEGLVNGDVAGDNDGITTADAVRLQQLDAGVITLEQL